LQTFSVRNICLCDITKDILVRVVTHAHSLCKRMSQCSISLTSDEPQARSVIVSDRVYLISLLRLFASTSFCFGTILSYVSMKSYSWLLRQLIARARARARTHAHTHTHTHTLKKKKLLADAC